MPLVGKAYRDTRFIERPDFFDEAIVQLFGPFSFKKLFNRVATREELRPIAPITIGGISERYLFGITRIPCIFSSPDFFDCCFVGKRG